MKKNIFQLKQDEWTIVVKANLHTSLNYQILNKLPNTITTYLEHMFKKRL
jgi:hypothetical protein